MKMWFLLLLIYSSTHMVHVRTQAKGKVILRGGENPCEGHVEIYYNNTAGHVGDKHWDDNTEKVVCRTTQCGVPVPGATKNVQRLENRTVWLNELQCSGNEDSLWDCPGYPAPGVSVYQKPTVKMIKCSEQVEINLVPSLCQGAAHFYKVNSGRTLSGYFCKDNWGDKDRKMAEQLCKSLGCGGVKEIPKLDEMMKEDFRESEKMAVDCADIDPVSNLWQCVRKNLKCRDPVVVTCEGHETLQLKGDGTNACSGQLLAKENGEWKPVKENRSIAKHVCKVVRCGAIENHTYVDHNLHLTCTDTVKVVLLDNNRESKCFGLVHVSVNGVNKPVCAKKWTQQNSETVCKELNCGKSMSWSFYKDGLGSGIMDSVRCTSQDSSLWHCKAKHGMNLFCPEVPNVICSGSVKFRLADGPGKCAGRLEVLHGGEWKRVAKSKWNEKYSDNICQRLNCGKTTGENHPERFFQGSGNFVSIACDQNQPDISECVKSEQNTRNEEAVGITCENHEVVFLKGSESCSGAVGIRQNNNTFWLSGSNETWNSEAAETLCQQMHCGRLTKFSSSSSTGDISNMTFRAYRCSGKQRSLFDCDKVELPDHNDTIAQVECSGKINVSLSEGCWGKVRIFAEGKFEYVCADSWTEEMSKTLCQETSCGETILKVRKPPPRAVVTFKSLHTVGNNSSLRESTFVKTEDIERCIPAYVVCEGSAELRFPASKDECRGTVEMVYEGDSLSVSRKVLTEHSNAICRKLRCGHAQHVAAYFGSQDVVEIITELKCSGDDSKATLETCSITAGKSSDLGFLQCSDWREMVLEEDGCKGEVAVYSEVGRMLVSSEGWTETEGNQLCTDLQCGPLKTKREVSGADSFWNKTFKCPNDGKAESIWDCETETPPSLQRKKLFIECQDRSKVSLSGYCSGQVRINSSPVCNKNWDIDYSNRVCQELNCGNAFDHSDLPGAKSRLYVSCDQHHHVLGQCHRDEGKCQSSVSVSCYKNITFQTTEKCGGQVQVNYGRNWKNVCVDKDTLKNSKLLNSLCKEMNCEYNTNARLEKINEGIYLECPTDYKDIKYCVKAQPCGGQTHGLIIKCAGFENTEPEVEKSNITVPLIVGIGTSLLVLILIPVLVRFWMVWRARKKVLTKMLPDREADQDSESYDEIGQPEEKAFKCESVFAEAAVIKERDVQSSSSLEYDDVDKAPEAQPLTPQGSKGNQKVADQSDDGEMCEVDDLHPTEDGPANMQTTVEVHNEPKATAENSTGPPEDEDYLVPDQDG
ncbi:scavenger receptor cysteine-rich type 1 protein M160 [Oryzias latipes]|uniref:scavenger receptor cysteine-rich type 1 protein M160 n=1 Tax=Oryzias latipes TaxID=8090 RepID=UPI000CE1670A|nr:scavenger receptor cysteine-rich type 1 protein M160 [Oryzias latipes]